MVIAAYLLGSVAFAIVISKIMGIADPRTFGSRNPGATNVLRSGKRSAAIATLVLDALKGFIPVLLMLRFATEWGFGGQRFRVGRLGWSCGVFRTLVPRVFWFQGGQGRGDRGWCAVWAGAYAGLGLPRHVFNIGLFQSFCVFGIGCRSCIRAVLLVIWPWRGVASGRCLDGLFGRHVTDVDLASP